MKKIVVIIVAFIIVLGGWLLLKANNATAPTSNNQSSPQIHSHSAQPTQASQAIATNKVTMQNIAFNPANITVKKGTTVTWTNQDAVEHTVTETDGQNGPNASPLSQGQSCSFTFNQPGTFYHCSIHSEMTGTVTVTAS